MANKINYTGSSKVIKRICEAINDIIDNGGGGGGTTNYENLSNKPSINGVTLSGNKTTSQLNLNIPVASADTLGGMKVGSGLSITEDGTLSTSGGSGAMTSVTGTLYASTWAGSSAPYSYDLGSAYANKSVFVGYDASSPSASSTKRNAAADAKIAGGTGTILYAYGTKPTVDIPIIITYG